MKWFSILVLFITGIAVVVIVIGALLPQKHTATVSADLGQPPENIWKLITGPPTWRPEIKYYEELPLHDGHRVRRETDQHGQAITYETTESIPPKRLVTRIADSGLPFGGTWTYDLSPSPAGCSLTITENGEVYNPIYRFVSRFVIGHSATLKAYVKALDTQLTVNNSGRSR